MTQRHTKVLANTPLLVIIHIHYNLETKKTWEKCLLRAYPIAQALALPLLKDKQLKPAHASDNIFTTARFPIYNLTMYYVTFPAQHTATFIIYTQRKVHP